MVDGKIYNQGDIVFTDNPIDGLELLQRENQLSEQLTAHKILRDFDISKYIVKENPEISVIITFIIKRSLYQIVWAVFIDKQLKSPMK